MEYAKAGGPPENWKDIKVTLDGVEVKYCIEANAKEGWVRKLKQDANGKLLNGPKETEEETLHGAVGIFVF